MAFYVPFIHLYMRPFHSRRNSLAHVSTEKNSHIFISWLVRRKKQLTPSKSKMIFARGAINMALTPRIHISFDSDEVALAHETVGNGGASAAAGKKEKHRGNNEEVVSLSI
jgi:hypothetical protein